MIVSLSNPHVKRLRSLRDSAKERRTERSVILEGVRLVDAALASGATFQLALYAPEQLATTPPGQALLEQLSTLPGAYAAIPEVVARAADTRTPQGVVAAVAQPELEPRPGLRLVLDAVQDPGNVGTLLRSAEAAGVGICLCTRGTADVYSPKVVRAAMGAHFNLPIRADVTWDDLSWELSDPPVIYAADAAATMPYYAADWKQPAVLIIGSEAHGVGEAGLALATHRISIPMVGRAESLNAGVAGSIILFEALRQRTRGRT
jgi:RNA methyltransferase, TrmH family